MADQKTSSIAKATKRTDAPRGPVGSPSPALVQLVRLLARCAAKEAFEASLIKPNGAHDAKD